MVDGERLKPSGTWIPVDRRPEFERLLKLKKSFLPAMYKTRNEKVFK